MLKIKLAKNRLSFLMEAIETLFDPAMLDRGWEYYHKGLVTGLDVTGATLHATVRGTKAYRVELDLDHFERSSCTCPYGDWCKHMVAVFFTAYAAHGRPELLLMQMKQAMAARRRGARLLEKAAAPKALSQPQPNGDPRDWQRYFDQKFYGYSLGHQHSVESFQETAEAELLQAAADWPATARRLYELHAVLFMLRKVEQFYEDNKSSYLSYHYENGCRAVARHCYGKLQEIASAVDAGSAERDYRPQWEKTIDYVGDIALQGKTDPVEWSGIYRMLWWSLFRRSGREAKEKLRVSQLLEQSGLTPRKEDVLRIARSHFDVMAGDDATAFKRLEALHGKKPADFYPVLEELHRQGEWRRLLEWLRWLLPAMAKARQDDFQRLCGYWTEAAERMDAGEEWMRVMMSLLPRSYAQYADFLIRTERYKIWIDLQLSNRISPLHLSGGHLKAVEAADGELLLPLYHQSIERTILEKNRASYKMAVRQLKRLHTLYKRLKQPERWDDYIHRLAVKFARLRAFQEELEKGKWLS